MSKLVHVSSALVVLLAVGSVRAQQVGHSINNLDVSERGSEWFSADSLDLRGAVRPAIGIVGEWAYRPLVARDRNGDYVRSVVRNQFVLHPGASVVLANRARVGVDVPIQAYADGNAVTVGRTTLAGPDSKTSLGDIRLGADVRLFGTHGDVITGAIGVQVALPTGDESSYAGDGQTRIMPRFLLAGDIAWFVYAARAGVTIRTSEHEFADTYVGSEVSYAVAAGARVLDKKLVIGPELFGHTSLTHDQFFKSRTTPVELLFGLHYMVVDGFRVGAGISSGVGSSGYGAPDRRGLVSLEWVPVIERVNALPPSPDRDHDVCPDQPGIQTADSAVNGCVPPPLDRDGDAVPDADDACPDTAGVRTGDPTTNGCPPPPPPPDRDADGVLDADDACPDQAGDKSADPTRNGCPAPTDPDGDGIAGAADACPNDAGAADPNPQRNGCPKAFVQGDQIRILDQVKFSTGKAAILPGQESEGVLLAVLEVLKKLPETARVRIEGHTDSRGSAETNRKLSKARAESVLSWLVVHGAPAPRLTSEGFGPDRPIDSNDTDAGRANNRRVEFHLEGETRTVP